MSIAYTSSLTQQAWTVPPERCPPGHKITYGFWIKDTTDHVVAPKEEFAEHDYVHKSLESRGSIRLLTLEPGDRHEPLSGKLAEYEFQQGIAVSNTVFHSRADYEALSYCWGERDYRDQVSISIDGSNFRISRCLWNALAQLRRSSIARVLWIDAICINQCDLQERSTQVPLMLDIYAGAREVHIWLGLSTENSHAGMTALELFCRGQGPSSRSELSHWSLELLRAGLEDVLSRRWFTRMWTIQEGAVASKVTMHCGFSRLSWVNSTEQVLRFSRAIKAAACFAQISYSWREAGLNHLDFSALMQLLQTQLERGPESSTYLRNRGMPDLLDVAYEMRHREAGDPRDKLWAIWGMVRSEDFADFVPDYTISVEDMWAKFEGIALSSDAPGLDSSRTITQAQQDLELQVRKLTSIPPRVIEFRDERIERDITEDDPPKDWVVVRRDVGWANMGSHSFFQQRRTWLGRLLGGGVGLKMSNSFASV